MSTTPESDLTALASKCADLDRGELDRLLPAVYDELRRVAESFLRRERSDHTLQTTALVHEAYMRIARSGSSWDDRQHFCRLAARVMRHILINHAQARRAEKRGGGRRPLAIDEVTAAMPECDIDLLTLDEALTRLGELDEEKARVVELRFFGGCTIEETAAALELSTATVERHWRFARAWLRAELGDRESA